MSQNTIEAIREAETKAAAQEKDAKKEAERIIGEARKQAEELLKARVEEAKKAGEEALARVNLDSDEIIRKAREEAAQEISALKDRVSEREAGAVDEILKALVF